MSRRDDDIPEPQQTQVDILDIRELRRERVIELLTRGWSYAAIGRDMGVSKTLAWEIAHGPGVLDEVGRRQKELADEYARLIKAGAGKALRTLIRNLRDGDGHVRNNAAKALLQAAGIGGTAKVQVSGRVDVGISVEVVRELRTLTVEQLREIAASHGADDADEDEPEEGPAGPGGAV